MQFCACEILCWCPGGGGKDLPDRAASLGYRNLKMGGQVQAGDRCGAPQFTGGSSKRWTGWHCPRRVCRV